MKRFYTALLLLILGFSFITKMWRLDYPSKYVFDEVYHAVTAKLIAHNDPRAFEWWNAAPEPDTAVDWLHPPLAKYTQAFFILVFGENSLGWRFSSVVFGVGVTWLTYELAYTLFKKRSVALLAAFLTSLDGLLLVQSRIAMNDIHVTFFILLTFLLYWKAKTASKTFISGRRLIVIGVSAGLALASKWSGLFALALIGLYEAHSLLTYWWQHSSQTEWQKATFLIGKVSVIRIVTLILLPIIIYISSYWLMFAQGKTLFCTDGVTSYGNCYQEKLKLGSWVWYDGLVSHFIELHHQIWWYQTHLEATHPYQSRPWQWLLNVRPVWYFVNYNGVDHVENIYAFGNPFIFWFGALTVVVLLSLLLLIKVHKYKKALFTIEERSALFFALCSYLIVWAPWQLSPRIMFFYHYTPAVPMLCILLAFTVMRIKRVHITLNKKKVALGKISAISYVVLAFLFFIIWYPHWTALSVSSEWLNTVYFFIHSWK